MFSRVRKFVSGHVDQTLHWIHRPPAAENNSFEGLEMILLNDLQRETYASVSFQGERAGLEESSTASAARPPPPPPLVSLLRAAQALLATPLQSQAVRRAFAAEQRFMARRVGSRFDRVSWIGWATLFWGLLLTLISSCGVILALTGDLGKVLVEQPGIWFVQFTTYLVAYSTVVHVSQVICSLLLLTAVKMAKTSPPRLRDPTEEEIAQWFSSLGFATVTEGGQSCQPTSSPSENPTPAPLPVSSPEMTPAVLMVYAQVEHNPDGQKQSAYTRSPSSAHSVPLPLNASSSTSRTPEAVECVGSQLDTAAESSMGSSPDGQGTTQRKPTRGSTPGTSTILQSQIEELRDEDTAARGTRTSNVKRAQKPVRLRTPWLWASAVTLATYTITAVAFYCSGSVAIPTTLCAIIVLSTPCILDVLAEVLEVPEKNSEDLERLFGTDPSYESHVGTSQPVTARSPEEAALEDRSSPEFSEGMCSLQLRDHSSE